MKTKCLGVVIYIFPLIVFSQAPAFNEIKVGHVYYVSLPEYLKKTNELNAAFPMQYQNTDVGVFFLGVDESIEELKGQGVKAKSITDYNNLFLDNFGGDGFGKKNVGKTSRLKIDNNEAIQYDINVKFNDVSLYYLITIIKDDKYFYRFICWTVLENKEKFKNDFLEIGKSFHD